MNFFLGYYKRLVELICEFWSIVIEMFSWVYIQIIKKNCDYIKKNCIEYFFDFCNKFYCYNCIQICVYLGFVIVMRLIVIVSGFLCLWFLVSGIICDVIGVFCLLDVVFSLELCKFFVFI